MNNHGFTFDCYLGEDGVPVVHVETLGLEENTKGPLCRIYINDEVLYENPELIKSPVNLLHNL